MLLLYGRRGGEGSVGRGVCAAWCVCVCVRVCTYPECFRLGLGLHVLVNLVEVLKDGLQSCFKPEQKQAQRSNHVCDHDAAEAHSVLTLTLEFHLSSSTQLLINTVQQSRTSQQAVDTDLQVRTSYS